jgi:predicted lactoylglutathione lyase
MPLKSIWLNLPVKNLEVSKNFYLSIGFNLVPRGEKNDGLVCMKVTEKETVVVLCSEEKYSEFVGGFPIADGKTSEMLISIDCCSREEIDEYATKVRNAGATLFGGPGEKDGWLYGFGFVDPDGHRWNLIYFDMEKVPGAKQCGSNDTTGTVTSDK